MPSFLSPMRYKYMINRILYTLSGIIIGFLIGVTMMSDHMVKRLEAIEEATDFYGLNTFMYGCAQGRKSKLSCRDVTKENEKNITLPRISNEDSGDQ